MPSDPTPTPATATAPAGPGAAELLPFQIVIGVTTAGVGGIVAVLGQLKEQFGFSETGIGLIVAAGFLASFVSQTLLASQADRGHARRMVVSGVVVAVAALLVMAVGRDVVAFVAARAAFGFAGGLILPGVRRAAAVLDPERVGENIGRLVVGEIGGFLVGPIVSGVLVEVGGLRLPFLVFAAVLAAFVPFVLRLPPDRGAIDTSGHRVAFDLLARPALQGALVLVAAYFGFVGAFEAVIPVMYADRGASALATGLAFSTFAIPVVALSTRAGRTADRIGPDRVAVAGITVVATSGFLYGLLPGYVWPAALMGVAGVADAFGFTAVQAAVARSVPEERQAAALGLMGAVQVLSAGLAAVPGATLYDRTGATTTWLIVPVGTLAVIGVAAVRLRQARRPGPVPAAGALHSPGDEVAG